MKETTNRTMSEILEELNNSVDKYNLSDDAKERNILAKKHQELVKEYNEASLLAAYAGFMQAEKPIIALAKAYYYPTVSVKDTVHNESVNGVVTSVNARAVNDSDKKLDIEKFVKWTEECNRCVAASKDWRAKISAARSSIEKEWRSFFASKADSKSISIGKVKKATQEAFDALVFVPCENNKDKNAIIADGDVAKDLIAFANSRKDTRGVDGKVNITANILPSKTWNVLLLDVLHNVVEGKNYTILYGDEKPEVEDTAEAEPKAEAEA